MQTTSILSLSIAARSSPLSQIQVQEVLAELQLYHPEIVFSATYLASKGDNDQLTSLRQLEKTDFFSYELDQLVLKETCRLAIHSAKDLPDPLPTGLTVVALTKGIDSSDALVLAEGQLLSDLPLGACIATSSIRREEIVKKLRPDLTFVDIRGLIHQRLAKLERGEVAGVVIAEAALIRLGLTHLNRVRLPGPATDYQGQLAIVARSNDREMQTLFACIDTRLKALYLGLDCPSSYLDKSLIPYPVIKIEPVPYESPAIQQALQAVALYTHFIFTSKTAVHLFFTYFLHFGYTVELLRDKEIVVVGKATAKQLENYQLKATTVAEVEQAEGIIQELHQQDLSKAHCFWPHSALSRPLISTYFHKQQYLLTEVIFYDTKTYFPEELIDLAEIDELIFTSPSTVKGFIELFKNIPLDKKLTCLGPITRESLNLILNSNKIK